MPHVDHPDPAGWSHKVVEGTATLREAKEAARACRACRLGAHATQTVFGEGPQRARIVFIGEQPGDREDLAGSPFVGPAGRLLDEALDEAGIDRKTTYLTNVVKHFSFEQRGKRRIHKKPKADEIRACRPWLDAELVALAPEVVVCLGATAAQAMMGRTFRVTRQRGVMMAAPSGARLLATVHPSSILREPDEETRREEMQRFIADLRVVAASVASPPRPPRR